MRRSCIMVAAVAVALGAVGCHHGQRYAPVAVGDPSCAPAADCPPDAGSGDIVVHTPKQRYVVKTPAPCPPDATCPPQVISQGVPQGVLQGVPQGVPQGIPQGVPQGMMGFPQQGFGYGAQPMGVMGGVPFGAASGGSSSTTVTTNQRTRLALTTTTIRIPIPWLKLTPFADAPETTIRISGTQTAQAQGFAGVPMGVMPSVPMGFGGGSLPGAPGSFVQGQVVGPPVGGGVIGVQGVPATQGVPQGVGPQGVCPPCPDPNAITPERLEALRKKIEELEAAKKAQDAMKKDTAPPPKEKP